MAQRIKQISGIDINGDPFIINISEMNLIKVDGVVDSIKSKDKIDIEISLN